MLITKLKCTSRGCPEQWEGTFDNGDNVYVRERNGNIRLEINYVVIAECFNLDLTAFEFLTNRFEIAESAEVEV